MQTCIALGHETDEHEEEPSSSMGQTCRDTMYSMIQYCTTMSTTIQNMI